MFSRVLLAVPAFVVGLSGHTALGAGPAPGDVGAFGKLIAGQPAVLIQQVTREPASSATSDPLNDFLSGVTGSVSGWFVEAEKNYQNLLVEKLKVKPEQSLLSDLGLAAPTRSPPAGRTATPAAPQSEPSVGVLDSITKGADDMATAATAWLDDSNRNYQGIVVRRLAEPGPSTDASRQASLPGSMDLFGVRPQGTMMAGTTKPPIVAVRTTEPPEVKAKAPPAPPIAQPAPPPAPALAEAPRAEPVERAAPPPAMPKADLEAQKAESARLAALEARRLAEAKREADRRLAEQRALELERKQQDEARAREALAQQQAEARRQQLAEKQRRLALVEEKRSAVALASPKSRAGSAGDTAAARAKPDNPAPHVSDASRRRFANTPRSSLGAKPPRQNAKKAKAARTSAPCSGRAGRRVSIPGVYVVAPGESLWTIAQRHSRNPATYANAIHRANRKTVRNPQVIRPCQKLRMPRG